MPSEMHSAYPEIIASGVFISCATEAMDLFALSDESVSLSLSLSIATRNASSLTAIE